ncbi:MAG TPA: hypothetical protein PK545_04960, partial [Deltaproteobacteria bacterium]|nr:hypothetical protein [Deltaproteobacteria bacterium]
MKKIPEIIRLPILFFLVVGLALGAYFLVNEIEIQNNIAAMREDNMYSEGFLLAHGIDVTDYVLYEEVFIEDGGFYLIFT